MNKYDLLMQEIVQFMDGTWLSRETHPRLPDKGPITGSSDQEIDEVERIVGKQLPLALRAWYRVAGKVPPYLNDHDMDYSLADLLRAQETAQILTACDGCEWKLPSPALAFSQRIGIWFLFLDLGNPSDREDPPIWSFVEHQDEPAQMFFALSAYLRDTYIGWLDFPLQSKENSAQIVSWRTQVGGNWLTRKHAIDELKREMGQLRYELAARVHEEDQAKDRFTGPAMFQQRWLDEVANTDLRERLGVAQVRLLWDWLTPPQIISPE